MSDPQIRLMQGNVSDGGLAGGIDVSAIVTTTSQAVIKNQAYDVASLRDVVGLALTDSVTAANRASHILINESKILTFEKSPIYVYALNSTSTVMLTPIASFQTV